MFRLTRYKYIDFMTFIYKLIVFLFCIHLVSCASQSTNGAENQSDLLTKPSATVAINVEKKAILIFGNSLTAGYGLESTESFPARLQQRIDSLKLPFIVVNAGVSGETSATGLSRIDWVLENQPVDVFILELGANDGLRGLPPSETQKNLKSIISKVKKAYPKSEIILAGMMVPPSMGQDYSDRYMRIFPEIAEQEQVFLIPFLLKDVGGIARLNQDDGIHPNVQGAKILAENVWEILEPLL